MRLRRSNLKEELYEVGLAESPTCACGHNIEDAEHFFQDCILYRNERTHIHTTLGIDLRRYQTEDLLEGEINGTNEDNLWLFHAVQEYIKLTKRFTDWLGLLCCLLLPHHYKKLTVPKPKQIFFIYSIFLEWNNTSLHIIIHDIYMKMPYYVTMCFYKVLLQGEG